MDKILIREIQPGDNPWVATIVRESLTEFGLNKPGTVYYDDTTDHLFELFQEEINAVYYVAEKDGKILGGAGIYPSNGLPPRVCELVKMYITKKSRGAGLGKILISKCLEFASSKGYETVYLETMHELDMAITVYEKFGFDKLSGPMGNTGHYGCDRWMKKNI